MCSGPGALVTLGAVVPGVTAGLGSSMWQAGEDDAYTLLSTTQCKFQIAVSRAQGRKRAIEKSVVQKSFSGAVLLIAFTACVSLGCAGLVSTRHPSGTRDGDFDNFVAPYAVAGPSGASFELGCKAEHAVG
jgi:hypothetical protein